MKRSIRSIQEVNPEEIPEFHPDYRCTSELYQDDDMVDFYGAPLSLPDGYQIKGTTYFYDMASMNDSALLPSDDTPSKRRKMQRPSPFYPSGMRETLRRSGVESLKDDRPANFLPDDLVHVYVDLNLIEHTIGEQSSSYKARCTKDNELYLLKRIRSSKAPLIQSLSAVWSWKKIIHPHIVRLYDVFTTQGEDDYSVIFLYDFHPGYESIQKKHLPSRKRDPFLLHNTNERELLQCLEQDRLPESLIWTYIIQVASLIFTVHSSSLACRNLAADKLLVNARSRIRLSCTGVWDVIYDNSCDDRTLTNRYQQDDFRQFGLLILTLTTRSLQAMHEKHRSFIFEVMRSHYSRDLYDLAEFLLSPTKKIAADLIPMIGARLLVQNDNLFIANDHIENELAKQFENGRLFRLLTKICTVCDRYDGRRSRKTSDKYILKLFKDYVFHQVRDDGTPWLDMSHIVQCLNKLDAAVKEKVKLVTFDERDVIIARFAEINKCLQNAFKDLMRAT